MAELEIQIREADLSDCESIWQIEKACFSDPWSIQDFEYQILSPNAKILGAYSNGKAVGFINVLYIAGELTVNNIAVLEKHRKKGVADKLMEHAFSLYPDAECALLEVRESNIPAQKLYEKHGFVKVGMRKNYYINPRENAWLEIKNMK